MTGKVRVMIGVATVALFGFLGASMVAEGRADFGGVLLVLAAFRGVVLVQQMRRVTTDEAPPSPPPSP